jgi:tetratricopeptide (TPR) repeat protein
MAGVTRIFGVLMMALLSRVALGQDSTPAPQKPANAEAWYKSAYDKRHNKDLDGAIADASEAIKLSPKTGKYWLERGISRGGKGDLDGALDDFNHAVTLAPENSDALRIRGLMKGRTKDFDGAIEDFGMALRISPKFSRAYGDRGDTYRQMGKIDLALADYNRALELDKKYFWFCESRGDILRSQGKLELAASDYRSALETVKDEGVRNRLQKKLAALALVQEDAAKETLKGIREAISSAKTVSVTFEIDGSVTKPGAAATKLSGSGTILFKEGNKAAVRMKMLREKGEQEFILVSDGKHLKHDAGEAWNRLGKIDPKGEVRPLPESLNIVLEDAWASGSLVQLAYETSGGGTEVEGLDVRKLESPTRPRVFEIKGGEDEGDNKTLSYKLDADNKVFDVRLWYDPRTKKPIKRTVRFKSEQEESAFTERFSEFALDAGISDDKFRLDREPSGFQKEK